MSLIVEVFARTFHAGFGAQIWVIWTSDDFNSAQYLFLYEGSALNWMVWDWVNCRPIFFRVGQDLDIKMFNIHQVEIESFYLGLAYILEKSLVERQRTMQRYGSLFFG